MKRHILVALLIGSTISGCHCATVEPGDRGVLVDWGKVQEPVLAEG